MKKALLVAALITVLLIAGCAPDSGGSEPKAADIRGIVTQLDARGDGIVMLIEAEAASSGQYDKASVRADEKTIVTDSEGNTLALEDIAAGNTAEAVFDGPVAESYPVQAYAGSITIIR